MSLNFLTPMYLWGLLGVSLPILVHLLTRRQQTHLKFSAVYLLLQSQKRSIKRARPNRLLLLLFRCLALICFCFGLAGTVLSLGESDFLPNTPSANVLVLDDSFSMSARSGDATLFEEVKKYLARWLEEMPSSHKVSLVLASNPPRVVQGWTENRQAISKWLSVAKPSFRTTHIGSAVSQAVQLLESVTTENKSIILLTDLDKNGWDEESFPEIPGDRHAVNIQVVDFSKLQTMPNRASITRVDVEQEFLTHSRVFRVHADIANRTDQNLDSLAIALWVNGQKKIEDFLNIPAGKSLTREFSFPYLEEDRLNGRIEIQDDGIQADNQRFFQYQPDRKIRTLVVDGDPKAVGHQSETYYLERALNPLASAVSEIEPTISTLAELPQRRLEDFSVVMLCNVRELPLQFNFKLESFVHRGGALIIALGDQVDAKYYNENLGNLLPVTLRSLNQVSADPFHLQIVPSDDHPVMKAFDRATRAEMNAIAFRSVFSVEPVDGKSFEIPMKFSNGFPAVIETAFGEGRIMLFVSSFDRDWNDFPIQPTFLPWIQRWVKYTAKNLDHLTQKSLLVGEPFVLEKSKGVGQVKNPAGQVSPMVPDTKEPVIRYADTSRPGIYEVTLQPGPVIAGAESDETPAPTPSLSLDEGKTSAFSVNVDPAESNGEKISAQEIRKLFPQQTVRILVDPMAERTLIAQGSFQLSTPLFLLMAFMLFLEGWLVRRE